MPPWSFSTIMAAGLLLLVGNWNKLKQSMETRGLKIWIIKYWKKKNEIDLLSVLAL